MKGGEFALVRAGGLILFCLLAGCVAAQPEGASLSAPAHETVRQVSDERLTLLERAVRQHGARARQARYDVNDIEHALAEIGAAMAQARTARSERTRLLLRREKLEDQRDAAARILEERLRRHDEAAAALERHKSAADVATSQTQTATPPGPATYFPQ